MKKKYSPQKIESAEKVAQEVVSCAITWGLAVVTIAVAKKRMEGPVEDVPDDDSVQIALAQLHEVLEKMKPMSASPTRMSSPSRQSVPPTADSMADVDKMFDAAFNSLENENGTRVGFVVEEDKNDKFGRFGPDELFQDEIPDVPKAGFNKRTVAAGFWLEREAYQPLKKQRSTPLHESGLSGEGNYTFVCTRFPLVLLYINDFECF